MGGYIPSGVADGKQLFEPSAPVTRQMLAKAVFMLDDFSAKTQKQNIKDLAQCENANIIQILVDNGIFALNNGNFEPERTVTNQEIINAFKLCFLYCG